MKAAFTIYKTGSIQSGENLSVYSDILTVCSSILFAGSGDDPSLNFCHQSVKDFLLDEHAEVRVWYHTTEEEANDCLTILIRHIKMCQHDFTRPIFIPLT